MMQVPYCIHVFDVKANSLAATKGVLHLNTDGVTIKLSPSKSNDHSCVSDVDVLHLPDVNECHILHCGNLASITLSTSSKSPIWGCTISMTHVASSSNSMNLERLCNAFQSCNIPVEVEKSTNSSSIPFPSLPNSSSLMSLLQRIHQLKHAESNLSKSLQSSYELFQATNLNDTRTRIFKQYFLPSGKPLIQCPDVKFASSLERPSFSALHTSLLKPVEIPITAAATIPVLETSQAALVLSSLKMQLNQEEVSNNVNARNKANFSQFKDMSKDLSETSHIEISSDESSCDSSITSHPHLTAEMAEIVSQLPKQANHKLDIDDSSSSSSNMHMNEDRFNSSDDVFMDEEEEDDDDDDEETDESSATEALFEDGYAHACEMREGERTMRHQIGIGHYRHSVIDLADDEDEDYEDEEICSLSSSQSEMDHQSSGSSVQEVIHIHDDEDEEDSQTLLMKELEADAAESSESESQYSSSYVHSLNDNESDAIELEDDSLPDTPSTLAMVMGDTNENSLVAEMKEICVSNSKDLQSYSESEKEFSPATLYQESSEYSSVEPPHSPPVLKQMPPLVTFVEETQESSNGPLILSVNSTASDQNTPIGSDVSQQGSQYKDESSIQPRSKGILERLNENDRRLNALPPSTLIAVPQCRSSFITNPNVTLVSAAYPLVCTQPTTMICRAPTIAMYRPQSDSILSMIAQEYLPGSSQQLINPMTTMLSHSRLDANESTPNNSTAQQNDSDVVIIVDSDSEEDEGDATPPMRDPLFYTNLANSLQPSASLPPPTHSPLTTPLVIPKVFLFTVEGVMPFTTAAATEVLKEQVRDSLRNSKTLLQYMRSNADFNTVPYQVTSQGEVVLTPKVVVTAYNSCISIEVDGRELTFEGLLAIPEPRICGLLISRFTYIPPNTSTIPLNLHPPSFIKRNDNSSASKTLPQVRVDVDNFALLCLNPGAYVNDVVIDFYLTYLRYEIMTPQQRHFSHIFGCFFYNRLLETNKTKEERHASVARWTRRVDIFEKDFLFVPVLQSSHWFLCIVCFPWLAGTVDYAHRLSRQVIQKGGADDTSLQLQTEGISPEFLQWRHERVEQLNREGVSPMPCVLIFDSLIGLQSRGLNVDVIREFLQVEWDSKYSSQHGPMTFTKETIRGYIPRVVSQKNGCDCGVFTLEYAKHFTTSPVKTFTRKYFESIRVSPSEEVMNGLQLRANLQELILQKFKEYKGDKPS